ncbi:unnamed protein product [Rotaria sp. Silwood1]|nr:unnamed protein product [Rotaria sp. Silwood1]CAF0859450.1 unnamed protein product [Rotaria sp. Silwood1]CAF3355309.1 unnamed protein product [Rotaria sp. Silwood1]CAF3378947.1 unnamed protein product [Rotaria sp. Silwood1]CAF4511805.1 unnamed protein product [Rotaria sp. Silwood1]
MFLALITLLIAIPFSSTGKIDHWSVGNLIITDPTTQFRLDIYSPTTPGSYPVLVFLTGLAGIVPAPFYHKLVSTIAEQNVILIGISKIENIKPEKVAVHIAEFFEWVVKPDDGASRLFAEHKKVKGVIPNTELLGFLSHSSAAHPLGQYLNTTCGPVKLIIMMNPVDGIDPFGFVQDFVTHPPTPLPFRTPALIISNGLDNIPAFKEGPPCAPNNISNDRWYRSLYGPTFLVNLTNYGHADNLDEPFHEASKLMCEPCKGTICDFLQYKTDEATLITSFVYAIFNRDIQQLKIIENPQSFLQSHVSNKYDLHDYDYKTGGPGGFCTHD